MERIIVAQNFKLDEFVDSHTYFTEPDHGLSKIDPRMFGIAQLYRTLKGSSVTINDWWSEYVYLKSKGKDIDEIIKIIEDGDSRDMSGYRPPHTTVGAKLSAHRLGQAIDPRGDEKKGFELIQDNLKLFYDFGLRRIENPDITKGWNHLDISPKRFEKGFIRVINRKTLAYRLEV